ncbi:hypothetical protein K6W55_02920, partial [Burkholderia dolosa]|nr:hypothetical protein [Burkholderia dolosa]
MRYRAIRRDGGRATATETSNAAANGRSGVRHVRASRWGAPPRTSNACAMGRKTPLWAESGVVGSAAAPGDAGEALVGQTSSSGVRLSDFAYYIS